MKKIPILSLGLTIALFGCAPAMVNQGPTVEKLEPTGKIGVLGVAFSFKDADCYINMVAPKSAAEQAGLSLGDKIVSVNGIKINSRDNRLRAWDLVSASPEQFIDVVIERGGTEKQFKIKIGAKDIYDASKPFLSIKRFILAGDQVSVANFVDDITHTGNFDPNTNWEQWEKTQRLGILNNFEQGWLGAFQSMGNFRLVDRASIEHALSELHFQSTGAVSAEDVKKIGKIVGATYICVVSFNQHARFIPGSAPARFEFTNTYFIRIVDTENGTIVHSSQYSVKQIA
jgi:membrane-associated protease RseP (regulator of RpoE activity)